MKMLQNFILPKLSSHILHHKKPITRGLGHKLNICFLKLVILLCIIYKLQYEEEKICELWKFKGMIV